MPVPSATGTCTDFSIEIEAPRRNQQRTGFASWATSSDAAPRNRGEVRSQCTRRDSIYQAAVSSLPENISIIGVFHRQNAPTAILYYQPAEVIVKHLLYLKSESDILENSFV